MNSRPGDVFQTDFQQGRPAYFDITIRNSLQSSYISMSAREAGAAALAGESEGVQSLLLFRVGKL